MMYNLTRVPRQWNGAVWGLVFMSTNMYMIAELLAEREKITFTASEMAMYEKHFRTMGVQPATYHKLLQAATWRKVERGGFLVKKGETLDR